MKRLVIKLTDGTFINIEADKLTRDGNLLIASFGDDLKAVVNSDCVQIAYLSEQDKK